MQLTSKIGVIANMVHLLSSELKLHSSARKTGGKRRKRLTLDQSSKRQVCEYQKRSSSSEPDYHYIKGRAHPEEKRVLAQ